MWISLRWIPKDMSQKQNIFYHNFRCDFLFAVLLCDAIRCAWMLLSVLTMSYRTGVSSLDRTGFHQQLQHQHRGEIMNKKQHDVEQKCKQTCWTRCCFCSWFYRDVHCAVIGENRSDPNSTHLFCTTSWEHSTTFMNIGLHRTSEPQTKNHIKSYGKRCSVFVTNLLGFI